MPPITPTPLPQPTETITPVPWYRQTWFKWPAIAASAVAVIGLIIGGVVYALWLNSPQKALLDAATQAMTLPGSYAIEAPQQKLAMHVAETHNKYSGDITIGGATLQVLVGGSTLYLKSPDPIKALEKFSGKPIPQQIADTINKKIAGKWLLFDLDTPVLKLNVINQIHCGTDSKDALSSNPSARGELLSAYVNHAFVGIGPVSSVNGDNVYNVSLSQDKLDDFKLAFNQTSFYQSLGSCPKPFNLLDNVKLPSDVNLKVALKKDSHRLDTITAADANGASVLRVTADYNEQPDIAAPADAVNVDTLADELIGAFIPR